MTEQIAQLKDKPEATRCLHFAHNADNLGNVTAQRLEAAASEMTDIYVTGKVELGKVYSA